MTPALIAVLALIGATGDSLIKRAASGRDMRWLAAGVAVYAASALGWFVVMRRARLTYVAAVYSATSVLALLAAGCLLFSERLTVRGALAAALAVGAVLLAE